MKLQLHLVWGRFLGGLTQKNPVGYFWVSAEMSTLALCHMETAET